MSTNKGLPIEKACILQRLPFMTELIFFTRNIYREILLDSLPLCQTNQGLVIHACLPY